MFVNREYQLLYANPIIPFVSFASLVSASLFAMNVNAY
jgi:hypothetical protein